MSHTSLKTYMHKKNFRLPAPPDGPSRLKKGLAVVQQRSATLHYNCMKRDANIIASWIVPDDMAEDGFGGGVVLGWEVDIARETPSNNYPVSFSLRESGEDWASFQLETKTIPVRVRYYSKGRGFWQNENGTDKKSR